MERRTWICGIVLTVSALVPASTVGRQATPRDAGRIPADAVSIADFEGSEPLSARWEASGRLRASRVSVADDARVHGVSGWGLRIEAKPPSRLRSKPPPSRPPLADCERVVIRVNAENATARMPVDFEVQFYAAARNAWWWRKVSVDRPGWQVVDLPLRYFRQGAGSAPTWEEVDRLAFWFRTEATIVIDGLELRRGASPEAAYLSIDDLKVAAFGADESVRVIEHPPFVLITDAPGLDDDRLRDALIAMYRRAREDFPQLPLPMRPVPLLVFARPDDYRDFWPRFIERFDSRVERPTTDGFTAVGVASSSRAADQATVRPVFVHEASHALLTQMVGLSSSGEWLLEGLGTRYQLAFSPQDIGPIVREGLTKVSSRTPFPELLNGKPIPITRHWQAATIIDWLLGDPGRKKRFYAALDAMRNRGTTDLRPLAQEYFGAPLEHLEQSWFQWARAKYAS